MEPALAAAERAPGSVRAPKTNGKSDGQGRAAARTVAAARGKGLPPYVVVCNSYKGLIRYGVKLTIAGVKGQTRVGSSFVDPESASNAAALTLRVARFDRAKNRLVIDKAKAAEYAASYPTRCRTYKPRSTTFIESDTIAVVTLIVDKRSRAAPRSNSPKGKPAPKGAAAGTKGGAKKPNARVASKRAAAKAPLRPAKRQAKPPMTFNVPGAHSAGLAGGEVAAVYAGPRQYSPHGATISMTAMQQQQLLTYRHFAAVRASAAARANAMQHAGMNFINDLQRSGHGMQRISPASAPQHDHHFRFETLGSPSTGHYWPGLLSGHMFSPRHSGIEATAGSGAASTAAAPAPLRAASAAHSEAASRAAAAESIGSLFVSAKAASGADPPSGVSKLLQRRTGGGAAGLAVAIDAPSAPPRSKYPFLTTGPLDSGASPKSSHPDSNDSGSNGPAASLALPGRPDSWVRRGPPQFASPHDAPVTSSSTALELRRREQELVASGAASAAASSAAASAAASAASYHAADNQSAGQGGGEALSRGFSLSRCGMRQRTNVSSSPILSLTRSAPVS